MRTTLCMTLLAAFLAFPGGPGAPLLAQQPKPKLQKPASKPGLIRDDQTQEPPAGPETEEIQPDPLKARKNYEIGLYYAGQSRWDAAMIRFRQAILYKPDFAEAKWKFLEMMEKKKDWANLQQFAAQYLEDPTMASYRKDLTHLLEKARKKSAQAAAKATPAEPPAAGKP